MSWLARTVAASRPQCSLLSDRVCSISVMRLVGTDAATHPPHPNLSVPAARIGDQILKWLVNRTGRDGNQLGEQVVSGPPGVECRPDGRRGEAPGSGTTKCLTPWNRARWPGLSGQIRARKRIPTVFHRVIASMALIVTSVTPVISSANNEQTAYTDVAGPTKEITCHRPVRASTLGEYSPPS